MKKGLLFALIAVFGLVQFSTAQKPVDVTATYLKNFKAPFGHTEEIMVPDQIEITENGATVKVDRFVKLTDWTTEGNVGEPQVTYTGWHLDRQKDSNKGCIGITVGWNHFADEIENAKIYQTATMPAGKYSLITYWGQDGSGGKFTYLVANGGKTIPDTTDLAGTIAHKLLNKLSAAHPDTIEFTLTAPTEVSLGCVATFPLNDEGASGKYCTMLKAFKLINWQSGTDYTPLVTVLDKANAITDKTHPEGNAAGKFPTEAWNEFKAARSAAQTIITEEFTAPKSVEEIAAAAKTLQAAIDKFLNSVVPPFKFSTDTEEYWYELFDRRAKPSHLYVGMDDATMLEGRLLYTNTPEDLEDPDAKLFKFVQKDGMKFYIYNKLHKDEKISYTPETDPAYKNVIGAFSNPEKETWTVGKSDAANYFVLQLVGVASPNMINSFGGSAKGIAGLWNSTSDLGNQWFFKKEIKPGYADFSALILYIASLDNITAANFPVGTASGQFSQAGWDGFVAAKEAAMAMAAREDDPTQPTQDEVDAAANNLKAALKTLRATIVPPFTYSTTAKDTWYTVQDRRPTSNYWKYDVDKARLVISTTKEDGNDAYYFKMVRPADANSPSDFLIYTKIAPEHAITYDGTPEAVANNLTLALDAAADTAVFVIRQTATVAVNKEYFRIALKSTGKQLNSFTGADRMFVGFYTPAGEDAGNDWKFISSEGSGVGFVKGALTGIYSKNRRIYSQNAADELSVFSVSGQKQNADAQFAPGVYIVTVKGKQGAAKVVVK